MSILLSLGHTHAYSHAQMDVIQLGQKAAARGWVAATGGNFSVRVDALHFAITATGTDKGALNEHDVLLQHIEEGPLPNASAETGIHLALYAHSPEIGAVVHVHSPAGILASLAAGKSGASFYTLKGYELLKAIAGITTHETTLNVPVFPNSQDIPTIAAQAEAYLQSGGACPAFLLGGHGLTVWGKDAAEAFRHAEALEFLFHIDLERRRLGL